MKHGVRHVVAATRVSTVQFDGHASHGGISRVHKRLRILGAGFTTTWLWRAFVNHDAFLEFSVRLNENSHDA